MSRLDVAQSLPYVCVSEHLLVPAAIHESQRRSILSPEEICTWLQYLRTGLWGNAGMYARVRGAESGLPPVPVEVRLVHLDCVQAVAAMMMVVSRRFQNLKQLEPLAEVVVDESCRSC